MRKLFFFLAIFLTIITFTTNSACSQNMYSLKEDNTFGKASTIYQYEYIHSSEFGYKQNGILDIKYIKKYNKNGNLTHSKTILNLNNIVTNRSYEYKNNKLVKSKQTYNNSYTGVTRYYYDGNGKLIKSQFQNPKGISGKLTVFSYDNNGLIREIKGISAGFYDTTYNNISTYVYKDDGRISEWSYQQNQNSLDTMITKFTYDRKGNITTEEDYRNNLLVSIQKYEYKKYDIMGNWLLRISYRNNEIFEITERVIEYYED